MGFIEGGGELLASALYIPDHAVEDESALEVESIRKRGCLEGEREKSAQLHS